MSHNSIQVHPANEHLEMHQRPEHRHPTAQHRVRSASVRSLLRRSSRERDRRDTGTPGPSSNPMPDEPSPIPTTHAQGNGAEENIPSNNDRTDSNTSSKASRSTPRTEFDENRIQLAPPSLSILDVAALVLNKQIGTGIFSTPSVVLTFTHSRGLSVALWTVGGLWTAVFLLVYLEFGNALPYNGAELVYLDEVFYAPDLLATILFSGFFLTLANSYGNAIQFAKHILLAALPEVNASAELDDRLVRFIAVTVITVACGIHWFAAHAGLFLNKFIACYKVVLLLVVFIAGIVYSGKHGSKWNENFDRSSSSDGMAAMVFIFYSYQGWENANYVAGEIRNRGTLTPKRILNIGALLGVCTVWVLYVLVTVTLYRVPPFENFTDKNNDLVTSLKFAPLVFHSSGAFKICIALSAFGNIIAVTYTAAKVKQSIAIQRILPFWRQLSQDSQTPKGALFLHWITSVIYITATPVDSDGYSFAVGLYTYGHVIVSTFVAIGLIWLQRRRQESTGQPYPLTFFNNKYLLRAFSVIFAGANVVILVFAAKDRSTGKIPRYWWPAVISIFMAASFIYWAVIVILQQPIGKTFGLKVTVYHDSAQTPKAIKDDILDKLASKSDGSERRVHVETVGWLKSVCSTLAKLGAMIRRALF